MTDFRLLTQAAGILISENADDPLLTPAEVAKMFRVDPKTISRWSRDGKLASVRTLGNHRRFRESEVRRLLQWGAES